MRCTTTLLLISCAVLSPSVRAEDESWNQTARREQTNTIPTIFGDLRRDGAQTAPAMPMPGGWSLLRVAATGHAVAWGTDAPQAQWAVPVAGTPPQPGTPTAPLVERRTDGEIRWRQNLGASWCSSEIALRGSRDDRTDAVHWGDLETDLVFTLYRTRYQAVALAVGALTPLGDREDWLICHGRVSDWSFTPLLGLRGSFGIGMCTLQIRGDAQYTFSGSNTIAVADAGKISFENRHIGVGGAIGLSFRPWTWVRVGAEQGVAHDDWRIRGGEPQPGFTGMTLNQAPLLGVAEFTPLAGLHLTGWGGRELSGGRGLDSHDRLIVGGSLAYVF